MNHHQMPFCKKLAGRQDIDFYFIATTPVPKDRLNLGYADMNKTESFILRAYESNDAMSKAQQLVDTCDALIISAAMDKWIERRIQNNKLTFQYEERIYKDGYYHLLSPRHILGRIRNHTIYQGKQMYMLCASAFCAWDLAICGSYIGKTFKWGYFPETRTYDSIVKLVDSKQNDTIFWAARFIDWKHPELPIEVARILRERGHTFHMTLAGNGPLWEQAKNLVCKYHLEDCVSLPGAMSPEKIREEMEQSSIFMLTSDRNEGWGAVLNESMNSGCAVVADALIGAVPYLVQNGRNGIIYKDCDIKDAVDQVEFLLNHPDERKRIGINAYETIRTSWNAEIASDRFVALAQTLLNAGHANNLFKDGVCSKAEILTDWWFKNEKHH